MIVVAPVTATRALPSAIRHCGLVQLRPWKPWSSKLSVPESAKVEYSNDGPTTCGSGSRRVGALLEDEVVGVGARDEDAAARLIVRMSVSSTCLVERHVDVEVLERVAAARAEQRAGGPATASSRPRPATVHRPSPKQPAAASMGQARTSPPPAWCSERAAAHEQQHGADDDAARDRPELPLLIEGRAPLLLLGELGVLHLPLERGVGARLVALRPAPRGSPCRRPGRRRTRGGGRALARGRGLRADLAAARRRLGRGCRRAAPSSGRRPPRARRPPPSPPPELRSARRTHACRPGVQSWAA